MNSEDFGLAFGDVTKGVLTMWLIFTYVYKHLREKHSNKDYNIILNIADALPNNEIAICK